MRHSLAFRALCAAALSLSFSSVAVSVQAQDIQEIVVPANDGYGMDECLSQGGACAKLVADSWCQINGLKTSISYRQADPAEITASLSQANLTTGREPVYIVSCKD